MSRVFISSMLFLLAGIAEANVTISVDVPINSPHQQIVLQNAKTKAVQASLDRLPSVVWGEQSLSNSNFHEQIKAIGFADADVEIKSETWDHANKILKITATVSWDQQKVMATLKEVQEGQDAKKTVMQIEKILNGLSAKDFLEGGAYRKQDEARLLANPFYLGLDMASYAKRYNETLEQMKKIKFQRIVEYVHLITIEPKGIKNNLLIYQIHFPDPQHLTLKFQSEDLQRFYTDNQEAIDAISVCTHAPFQTTNYLPRPLSEKILISRNFEILIRQKSYVISSLTAGLEPIYFHPCDQDP